MLINWSNSACCICCATLYNSLSRKHKNLKIRETGLEKNKTGVFRLRFYVFFSSVVIVFVLNLTLFLQLQLFILHSQLLRSAACRQFFPTFSGNGNIFFATHLTFLIRSSPLRPRGKHFNLTIFYFPVFPFLFFFLPRIHCSFWFASIRFFLYKIRYLCKCLPASRCLCFCGASILVFWFFLFIFISIFCFLFSISRASHWSADKQQTSCVFVRWKSALFVCVFICISLFYCWLYLFLSAAKCCIHLLHISASMGVAFWYIYISISIDLHAYIRIRCDGRIRVGFCLFCA